MNHFVMTDTHGNKDLFDKCINFIRQQYNDDWYVFFLGDAADRGKDGYAIIKEILNSNHFSYIKGNHEDIFVKAARTLDMVSREEMISIHQFAKIDNLYNLILRYDDIRLSEMNGGLVTLISWIKDGAPLSIINQLDKLPYTISYDKFDMCHAGCTKEMWEHKEENQNEFLWNRNHFLAPWYADRVLIHGHTTLIHLPHILLKKNNCDSWKAFVYKPDVFSDRRKPEGLKIDLDTGMCHTNIAAVYCLEEEKAYTIMLDQHDDIDF